MKSWGGFVVLKVEGVFWTFDESWGGFLALLAKVEGEFFDSVMKLGNYDLVGPTAIYLFCLIIYIYNIIRHNIQWVFQKEIDSHTPFFDSHTPGTNWQSSI